MISIEQIHEIFNQYGGMMRTFNLSDEKIYYKDIQSLIEDGYIEKVRYGYYQWIDIENLSEAGTITRLFPDGIFCMYTALRYYDYIDRTPGEWHIAVSKDSNKSRFKINYPFVKPYYIEPVILEIGLTQGSIDGNLIRVYNKERTICDCLRCRNKMDKEIFNKAIQSFLHDTGRSIPRLMEYAEPLRVVKTVRDLIGVWM